jgi:2-keto-4-pentenoate hydratase
VNQPCELHTIVCEIKAAQEEARQIEPLTSRFNCFDVASAYEVAHLIHEARLEEGNVSVGRKIGFTNPLWDVYGMRDPIWAYVYDNTLVRLSSTNATCAIGGLSEPKIEPEVVVHFRSAPPIGDDLSASLDLICWLHENPSRTN